MGTALSIQRPAESAAFYKLPPEVLSMISELAFEESCDGQPRETTRGSSQLGTLRLTHRNFAYLEPLLKKQFQIIALRPRPHFQTATPDWTNFGRYVKEVVFQPCFDFNGLLETDLAAAQNALVKELQHFTKLRCVRINADTTGRGWTGFPSRDRLVPYAMQCLGHAESMPVEISFEQMLEPEEEEVLPSDQLVGRFAPLSERSQSWDEMNTPCFSKITVKDETLLGDMASFSDPVIDVIRESAPQLEELNILTMSHPTQWPPHELRLPMRKLRTLRVEGTTFDPREFAALLDKCPALNELHIIDSQFHDDWATPFPDNKITNLRPLLDTIRKHPSRMLVNFQGLGVTSPWYHEEVPGGTMAYLAYLTDLDLTHHTAHEADLEVTVSKLQKVHVTNCGDLQEKRREQLIGIVMMLKDYMSGRGEWSTYGFEPDNF